VFYCLQLGSKPARVEQIMLSNFKNKLLTLDVNKRLFWANLKVKNTQVFFSPLATDIFIYKIHTMSDMDTLAKNGYSKGFGVRFTDVLVVYG
jgi:hypothetical protein